MSQDAEVLAAAYRKYRADRDRRREALEARRAETYRRLPELRELDRELSGAVTRMLSAAFGGGDPDGALRRIEADDLALQARRRALLESAGYPEDYLDDAPRCRLCGDTGYLSDGTMCRCLADCCAKEQNRRLSKLLDLGNQSFDTFSFDWYDSVPWPEYGKSPLENMETIREICGNYAHTFSERSGNLLFSGPPGLGKTFLSACIAREVSDSGFSVVYDTAGQVFRQFEREKFGREDPDGDSPDRDVDRYLNCDLLIMDDLGTEMRTSFVQSAFYRIVNDRLLERRKTVLSTNLAPEELEKRYGAAAASRIGGEYQTLVFFGDDIRLQRRDR